MQDQLTLISACMPFLAQASGIPQAQLYMLPLAKIYSILGEHGSKLMVRVADLKASGKDIENEICLAEAMALQPLATIFKPQLVKSA